MSEVEALVTVVRAAAAAWTQHKEAGRDETASRIRAVLEKVHFSTVSIQAIDSMIAGRDVQRNASILATRMWESRDVDVDLLELQSFGSAMSMKVRHAFEEIAKQKGNLRQSIAEEVHRAVQNGKPERLIEIRSALAELNQLVEEMDDHVAGPWRDR